MRTKPTINSRAEIDALEPRAARYRAWDAQVPGLCIRVTPSGNRTWYYEYRDPAGARQAVKIGDAVKLNPGDARKVVRSMGLDPAAEKREAKESRRRAQAEKKAAASRTLSAYLKGDYAQHLATARSGQATLKRIAKAWEPVLERDMATLVALDLERLRRDRLRQGLAPQTLNRDWSALRALLNKAREDGLISSVPSLKMLPESSEAERVRYLGQRDPGERERFLAALDATPEPARTVVVIAYWTGMRRGEVFGLEWRDINLALGQIRLRAETTKSGKGRVVPLHPRLAEHLEGLHRVDEFVVPSPLGGRLTTIKTAWGSLMKRAALSDFRLHDLRHDFASRLVMRGTGLDVVRDILGHHSVEMTERYAHLSPDHLRQAVEALG